MTSENLTEQINYWKNSADRDFKAAKDLFLTKHYDACLFFCHLAIEKTLKGLVTRETKQPAPYIHDLSKLAGLARLNLPDEKIQSLRVITTFNISGRYDNIKLAFYKQCTREFTKKHMDIAQKLYLWLKQQYKQK